MSASELGSDSTFIQTPEPVDINAYKRKDEPNSTQGAAMSPTLKFSSPGVLTTAGPPDAGTPRKIAGYSFFTGLYLMPAATAAGKTLLFSSLCAWINTLPECGASLLYVFEPRYQPEGDLWKDPASFYTDLETATAPSASVPASAIMSASTANKATSVRVLIVDSLTLPTLEAPTTGEKKGTQKGGFEPAWLNFIIKLGSWAVANDIILIGSINSEQISASGPLIGASEGSLRLNDVGNFNYVDRSSRNVNGGTNVQIPISIVQAVLDRLNLGQYVKAQNGDDYTWTPRYAGLKQ
jgi:hypothetical protein